jgi:hypothetical protein
LRLCVRRNDAIHHHTIGMLIDRYCRKRSLLAAAYQAPFLYLAATLSHRR